MCIDWTKVNMQLGLKPAGLKDLCYIWVNLKKGTQGMVHDLSLQILASRFNAAEPWSFQVRRWDKGEDFELITEAEFKARQATALEHGDTYSDKGIEIIEYTDFGVFGPKGFQALQDEVRLRLTMVERLFSL